MPTATQITFTQLDLTGACCQALFSSGLQPSDAPTADMAATAISRAVQQFGIADCVGQMVQEFGDQPDAAAKRMRWVRQLITSGPRSPIAAGSGMNETCDRCGPAVQAVYRASRDGQLELCGHCANQLRPALSAQGWVIWPIGKYALAAQAR